MGAAEEEEDAEDEEEELGVAETYADYYPTKCLYITFLIIYCRLQLNHLPIIDKIYAASLHWCNLCPWLQYD